MRTALPIGFVLAFALTARAADPFADLARLDRVEVTDSDGNTFRGIVRSVVRGRLSIQLEGREGLTGSLAFDRKAVRSVAKTGTATDEELTAASTPPPPPPEGFAEPEHVEPPPKVEPPPPRPVLEAFPPAEWSAARRDAIASKDVYLRTSEEREFLARFDEWRAASEARDITARKALLAKFPPGEIWNEAALKRLRFTTAVIGRALTDEEKEFLTRFVEWQQAKREFAR